MDWENLLLEEEADRLDSYKELLPASPQEAAMGNARCSGLADRR